MGNKKLLATSLIAIVATALPLLRADGPKATLEQQLEAQYPLTTPTADNTDIVIMGSVLILQKKGFSAGAAANKVPTQNTYQDGQIKAGAATTARRLGGLSSRLGAVPGLSNLAGVTGVAGSAAGAAGPSRDFVNGEKLYLTQISVDRSKDAVAFYLISDAYGDAGRYKGSLTFQFPKGTLASADLAQVQPVIAQVFKIAPPDQNAATPQGGQQAAPAAPVAPAASTAYLSPPAPVAQAQPEAPLAPIPPPPPPPPDPVVETKSIEVGQTKDQVTAILGKPDKTFKAGTKEIYQYKDIKVTFVNGKMTDAQ
jgi:hypothetical protein